MTGNATEHVAAGFRHIASGNIEAARLAFKQALGIDPNHADALHGLGILTYQEGQTAQAAELIQRALKSRPRFPDAESNLATVLASLGRLSEAEAALRRAIALNDKPAAYHFNLGNIVANLHRLPEAIESYKSALERQPEYPEALSNMGTAYRDLENLPAATKCYEKAVQQRPTYAEAVYNLANAYRDATRLSDAETYIRRVIALHPNNAKAHNSLGNILSESALSDEALASFQQASRLDPTSQPMASNVPSCLQYVAGIDDERLRAAHTHWVGQFNGLFTAPLHRIGDRNPNRPLRIGFVSPDFGHHPCGYLSVRLFENLNAASLKPIVFSTRRLAREDDVSARIAKTSEWRRITDMTDADLANEITAAKIDILLDMSGHTSGHKLGAFARKPAPVQMTWLGYVGSTGLPTMDYIIADRWHAPSGHEPAGPEKYLRLDDGYACFDPPADIGEVTPLPALKNGYVTFGCLNNATKLNPDVITSYATILKQTPGSRLMLAFRGLDDAGVKTRLLSLFQRHGIDTARIDIRGYSKRPKFLANYNDIDIALDTFPYSGGLTTCEALWMGVPVVTFSGRTFAGRHATSYMSNAGLIDFVASTRTDFEGLATQKAADLESLAKLRAGLRAKLSASPICDGKRFAESFEKAMRAAWKAWAVKP